MVRTSFRDLEFSVLGSAQVGHILSLVQKLVPGQQICIGKDDTVLSSRNPWSQSEGNMLVNAVVKGPTVCYGIEERDYLGKGTERQGFTQVTQIHVWVASSKLNKYFPGQLKPTELRVCLVSRALQVVLCVVAMDGRECVVMMVTVLTVIIANICYIIEYLLWLGIELNISKRCGLGS